MILDLSSNVAGVHFDFPVMNASGPRCTSSRELFELLNSSSGGVVTKSMTSCFRSGNDSPKYYAFGDNTFNSNGLQNLGFEAYFEILRSIFRINYTYKPIIASVAVLNEQDCFEMIDNLLKSKLVDMIEVNPSCPNIEGREILTNNFDDLDKFVRRLMQLKTNIGSLIPIGLKLPFYTDNCHFHYVDDIVLNYGVDFVTAINSLPYSVVVNTDSDESFIHPNSGVGGLGGPAILNLAQGQVYKHYQNLQGEVPIIGVGGVTRGVDVYNYFLCGASAVQIGSAFSVQGISIFDKIKADLEDYMKVKSVDSLKKITGKLKIPKAL